METGSSLRDSVSNLAAYPALKRWAKLVRPCRGWNLPALVADRRQLTGWSPTAENCD